MAPDVEKVSAAKIAEVRAFVKAQRALEHLKNDFPEAFARLKELEPRYNTALEAARVSVKRLGVSCGPFDLYQWRTKRDARAFHDAVGEAEFIRLGGVVQYLPSYDFDDRRFEALVVDGKVAPEVVEKVVSRTPAFHQPAMLCVP